MSKKASAAKERTDIVSRSYSHPLLCGVFCFLFWFLLFILTDIYVSCPFGFGSREVTALGVIRSRLLRADFSDYTFDTGMGMSFPRLLLSGCGGILSFPVSLLPGKVHPQAAAFLDALRLALGSAFFFHLVRTFRERSGKIFCYLSGFTYSVAAFLLCLFLRFPVSGSVFLLPVVLLLLLRAYRKEKEGLSLLLLLTTCLLLLSGTAWTFIALPVLFITILLISVKTGKSSAGTSKNRAKTEKNSIAVSLSVHILLAVGLSAFLLFPQYAQVPYALGRGEPSSSLLQQLGCDTDRYHTDVTYHCGAMSMILHKSPSLLAVVPQNSVFGTSTEDPSLPSGTSSENNPDELSPSAFSSHFAFLNEWFYSLWPSLPVLPFQDTSSSAPDYSVPKTVTSTVTTMFMDPLYCAVTLPHREKPAEVFINDREVATISQSHGTVLLELGEYNVGQTLTLKITSSRQEELADAVIQFGYLNSLNWNAYTGNANFGIVSMEQNADGITAEAMIGADCTLLSNIPFEKGWALYLNGTKIPVHAYRDSWVCANVTPGNYIVHLHYTAPGSFSGGLISAMSFLGSALYLMLRNRKKTQQA